MSEIWLLLQLNICKLFSFSNPSNEVNTLLSISKFVNASKFAIYDYVINIT